jgi:hypothetical protein
MQVDDVSVRVRNLSIPKIDQVVVKLPLVRRKCAEQ